MSILQFKRHSIVQDIINCLQNDAEEVTEAVVLGKRKNGERFSYMTITEDIPELVGYLEAIKTDLILEMISQAERSDME